MQSPPPAPWANDRENARAMVQKLGQSIKDLEAELGRLRGYWLCIEGLTVEGFIAGAQYPTCGLGKEHAAALSHEQT